MSSVKLQGGALGAGSVALVAPNTDSVRSLTLPDFDGLMIGSASAGTAGQVLTSAGAGAAPTWETVTVTSVTSVDVSGGSTGLTFYGGPITTSGTITLDGTLAVAYGGTGVTTSTGTGSVVLSDSPTLVTPHLGTPSAVDLANASNLSLISGVTGVLPIANGGTGTTTSTGTGSVVLSESPTFTGTVTASVLTVDGQLALGATTPISLNGWQGTAGQVLTSAGGGATPTWETVTGTGSVTSVDVSGGSTGLTFYGGPVTSSGTITLDGTLAVAYGGTGLTSYTIGDLIYASDASTLATLADAAIGSVLISGGVGVAPSYGKVDLTTHVTGTLPVAEGGTGTTTSTGTGSVVLSSYPTFTGTVSTDSLTVVGSLTLSGATASLELGGVSGDVGQVLTSAGPGTTPTWTTPTTGTVTSVDVSGGSTGMTFYGGPITGAGTITLDGTLAVAYGGTGTTTSTGAGAIVLSESPTLAGIISMADTQITGSVTLVNTTSPLILNTSAGTAGQVLTSAGGGATPTWETVTGTGSVTSVDVSGGSTGLTFYGGPVTSSGTITLDGTLAVAYGGTGTTTSTGTGSVVLSDSPTFTGTVSGASLSLTEQLGVGSAPLTGVTLKTYNGLLGTPVATGTDVTGVNSRFQSADVALDLGVYSSGSCFMQTRLVSDHSSMFTLALNPLGGSILVGTSVHFSNQLVTGDSGTAVTIDFSASQKQALVLTDNCTISTVFPGIGNYQLLLAQDSIGGRTVTWAGSVQYVGSVTAPAINTVANAYTMVSIYWNGDAMWLAASKVNA